MIRKEEFMKIEIIGANTINGIKLRKQILKAVNRFDGKVIVNLVDDYTCGELPCLYINRELICKGIVPSEKEIVKYLKKAYKE